MILTLGVGILFCVLTPLHVAQGDLISAATSLAVGAFLIWWAFQ